MTGRNQRLEPTLTDSFRNRTRRGLPRAPTAYASGHYPITTYAMGGHEEGGDILLAPQG